MFVCFVVVGFFGGRLFGCVGWVFFFWKKSYFLVLLLFLSDTGTTESFQPLTIAVWKDLSCLGE